MVRLVSPFPPLFLPDPSEGAILVLLLPVPCDEQKIQFRPPMQSTGDWNATHGDGAYCNFDQGS